MTTIGNRRTLALALVSVGTLASIAYAVGTMRCTTYYARILQQTRG